MRTFYCKTCQDTFDISKEEIAKCKGCSEIFGKVPNFTKNHVNMRTTWSGQTKMEFTQTTMEKDIAQRNSR